jgi:hypothetical protein
VRSIFKPPGSRHRARVVVAAVIAVLFGSTGVAWADDPPTARSWGFAVLLGWSDTGVYTGLGESGLHEDYGYSGGLIDSLDATLVWLPAGAYHLSGEVDAKTWSQYDREVSCDVFARAAGDSQDTVIASTSGPLPGLSDDEYYNGDNVVHTFRGVFTRIVQLNAPAQVWIECTGGDDPQTPWDPDNPDDMDPSALETRLIATSMSAELPAWLTGG